MSPFELVNVIHFNNYEYPTATGRVVNSNDRDWVFSQVSGTGQQTARLYCLAVAWFKIHDFFDYFASNEVLWYQLKLNKANQIIKILKVHSFALEDTAIINDQFIYPVYEYQLKSIVTDVRRTDDGEFEVFEGFSIQY